MASGHVNRIYRPNTWLHRPNLAKREESSCQLGAVHTDMMPALPLILFGYYPDSQNQGGLKTMAKSRLKLIAPATEKRTVMPTRQPNTAYRTREHLTEREVTKLMNAAKANRWGQRDATMILVAYRHGLRVSELVDLRWDQIDFDHANLHVRRVKKGTPSTHPIRGDRASCGARWCGGQAWLPGAPAHAAGRLWLCAGQQGPRYARPASLPRAQEHSAHGALHRAVT
jgi:integrase